jgi:hypothetical protein
VTADSYSTAPSGAAGHLMLADEPDGVRPWPLGDESALDGLRSLAREFSSPRQPLWCPASLRSVASGKVQVFRVRPGQSMHVVGVSPLAAELRRLLMAGAEPGWALHPVPGGRTPLHTLAVPLRHLSGNGRFYNLLDRSGFVYVEEVAATPDECLMDLRNGGPGFVAAVRQAITVRRRGTAARCLPGHAAGTQGRGRLGGLPAGRAHGRGPDRGRQQNAGASARRRRGLEPHLST